ncbi:hypothetical protein C6Y11_11190 [Lactiplantibacillus pentosus]|uniref:hypothetical protein n=1 Tax=Lactiplantibacillus pentosus TaxID=1589 RepID=UPI000D0130A5|nr:hypothetical protein [Lactiplantibacillus pentosus]MCT3303109.1 hypothetical protein [Lactiplantibacillus pentosus]MDC6398119.1 hypothetical protein [Lactiplantibacillus pentosus]PRO76759.1 hypothetical protein C6Y09_17075 [Lactiplantibacillus pentosus]PRO78665.1 hypothetical protein C6Y11_11190 [Lactiplantibacillus pentosus]PRO87875.1 hypothetical protein C6Y12_15555 [Lactiplantibacillus pentosus]
MIYTRLQVVGMGEVGHTRINKNREVRPFRFSLAHVLSPLGLYLVSAILLLKIEPQDKLLKLLNVGDSILEILASYKWAYPIVVFVVISIIIKKFFSNILHRKYLLHTQREYYLGPIWLLGIASWIDSASTLNARSIPVWQFFKLLILHESILYNNLEIDVPEVSSEASSSKVTVSYTKGTNSNFKRLMIGISDTYKIDYNKLPSTLKCDDYVEIRSDHGNNREYSSELVKKCVEEINKAQKAGITEISILPNTIPKHIQEIVRECFSDAGRNGDICVYVNENPRSNNYNYTIKRHRIL